jgi:hypothetical protein
MIYLFGDHCAGNTLEHLCFRAAATAFITHPAQFPHRRASSAGQLTLRAECKGQQIMKPEAFVDSRA